MSRFFSTMLIGIMLFGSGLLTPRVSHALSTFSPELSTPSPSSHRSFGIDHDHFVMDGQPFRILSGEIHYPRVPHQYWRQRFQAAKALGLNTVTAYVFWNVHETKPGVFDFSGDANVAQFIREAQAEGLYVILRPGPYVCAEWELGGFPSWLLKDHSLQLRSRDPKFIAAARSWFKRLGEELAPLQLSRGGPIIAIQVENEYGSFGNDHVYMDTIRTLLLEAGFTDTLLYTADGSDVLANGTLPDLLAAVNFGEGDAQESFSRLNAFRAEGPKMAGEYWAGWFDDWGDVHHTTKTEEQVSDITWMYNQGYSMSLYMFHGGTNFGWMGGANVDHGHYNPYVTSYDYDAPLDESGRPTEKYTAIRAALAQLTGLTPPEPPVLPDPIEISEFKVVESRSLWSSLPKAVESNVTLTMEDLDQSYGYILYRTELKGPATGELRLNGMNDYAQVYLDHHLIGVLDRRQNQDHLTLPFAQSSAQLDILVMNSGRINYGSAIQGERKGIKDGVTLGGKPLTNWKIYSLPMKNTPSLSYAERECSGPCFFKAEFKVREPGDTFLDVSAIHKGMVWLNGRPLGRVWNIGPQSTLFVPGVWLKKGLNQVTVFDSDADGIFKLRGVDEPSLDIIPHSAPVNADSLVHHFSRSDSNFRKAN